MDFVAWCHRFLETTIRLYDEDPQASYMGVRAESVCKELLPDVHTDEGQNAAFIGALQVLKDLGFILTKKSSGWLDVNRLARTVVADPVSLWEGICSIELQPHEQQILEVTNRLSECSTVGYAWIDFPKRKQVLAELDWPEEKYLSVARELSKQICLLASYRYANPEYGYGATYRGLVWQKRRGITLETRRIEALVAEWETTSVDFKRELYLNTADEKAEFVKDILGLANTQSSGKRYLIVGFDDKTRSYHSAPDAKITSERLEQILAYYTAPVVPIRYSIIPYAAGPVGQVEVLRNAVALPYKAAESLGDKKRISKGDVFVRHGSLTQKATDPELRALQDEATRAGQIR